MTTQIQVRVYPGDLSRSSALYAYNTKTDGPLPVSGDPVRFDLSNLTGIPDGFVRQVSWTTDFTAVIVDVVVPNEHRVHALGQARGWMTGSSGAGTANGGTVPGQPTSNVPGRVR
jgi:hypothetical protein